MLRVFHCCNILTVATVLSIVLPTTAWSQADEDTVDPATQPVENSPLLVEPKTPEATFDAIILIVDLGRPKLALRYLQKLMAMDPTDEAILNMRDKHGPAAFLKLSNIKELQPTSLKLLTRMNTTFRKWATDPKRVDEMIDQLSQSPQKREVAIIQLRSAGPVVVPRLLAHLNDPTKGAQRSLLLYSLTQLGRSVIPPLLGALDTPDADLRATVVDALGWVGASDVVPYLWYPAFGSDQETGVRTAGKQAIARILGYSVENTGAISSFGAAAELEKKAQEHFSNQTQWKMNDDGKVEVWSWSTQNNSLTSAQLSPNEASQYIGSQFARQALALSPENADYQALYVAFRLAEDVDTKNSQVKIPTGPGTAHDLALTAGEEVVSKTLALSLKSANGTAALAALQVLSQIGTRHQLYVKDAHRSPLMTALNYPDSRIQFAAATTILQLDPNAPFRGSDRVVAILQRALMADGMPRTVVVDANVQRAGTMAGIVQEMGYDPLVTPTGQQGFKMAAERGDVELILLQTNTIRWALSQTIANLRADSRTAAIPIVVYGSNDLRFKIQRLLDRYPLTMFAVESTSTDAFNTQIRPFLTGLISVPISPQGRIQQMRTAAFWFAHIANGQRTRIFDIQSAEHALSDAAEDTLAAANALTALGSIPTNSSQVRLADLAANSTMDITIREAAALQLAFHLQRFGLLLKKDAVSKLRQAWNVETDPALKTALSSVVGSLKPTAAKVTERLQKFPLPVRPGQPVSPPAALPDDTPADSPDESPADAPADSPAPSPEPNP